MSNNDPQLPPGYTFVDPPEYRRVSIDEDAAYAGCYCAQIALGPYGIVTARGESAEIATRNLVQKCQAELAFETLPPLERAKYLVDEANASGHYLLARDSHRAIACLVEHLSNLPTAIPVDAGLGPLQTDDSSVKTELDSDAAEQAETWEYIKQVLEEDRMSQRKLFP